MEQGSPHAKATSRLVYQADTSELRADSHKFQPILTKLH